MKFGTDCDGDVPIEVEIIDRTRFERVHSIPLPYSFDAGNEKLLDILYLAIGNVMSATQRVDSLMKLIRINQIEKEKS